MISPPFAPGNFVCPGSIVAIRFSVAITVLCNELARVVVRFAECRAWLTIALNGVADGTGIGERGTKD